MSNRRDEFKSQNPNPAARFIEWSSNDKCFKYYDKETKENKLIKLPFKFLVLKQLSTIKGWHDASQSGIYSNEVVNTTTDVLKVKAFKGGVIAEGFYKDIKDRLQGGDYHQSVYVMLSDGSIGNLSFKGSVINEWIEFTKKTRQRLPDEWVAVKVAKDGQKGAVKYSTPSFEFLSTLAAADSTKADAAYDVLTEYFKGYFARSTEDDHAPSEPVVPHTAGADVSRFESEPPNYPPSTGADAPPIEGDDDLPFRSVNTRNIRFSHGRFTTI